jgi:hypothetical protein
MKTLPIPLEKLGFVERERRSGKIVTNRCGRDFLYYALHYYFPDKFNPNGLSPLEVERRGLFGLRLPSWLMWTQLQFVRLPRYLASTGVTLVINDREILSFGALVAAILFSRMSYRDAIRNIERAVDEQRSVGVDISLGYGGLLDHVVFVYGYDADNLYVCDTHQVPMLEYTRLTDDHRYFMKLPKAVVQKRWTRFGRVWELKKLDI